MGPLVMQPRKRHQLHSVPVAGKGKRHCIIRIIRSHELGGIHNNLINIGGVGITDFGSPDNDPLTGLSVHTDSVHIGLHYMNKGIRIRLHVGSLIFGIAGALHISLGTVAYQVIFLAVFNVF